MRSSLAQGALLLSWVILLSAVAACSRERPSDASPRPSAVAVVQSAVTGTPPNCTGAGDPTTGQTGATSCTGNLAQVTFARAICSCHTLNASARLVTDAFDSTKGPPNGGLGGSIAANGSESWSSQVTIGGDLVTPGNLSSSTSSEVKGNLFLGGTLSASGAFKVDGNASTVKTLPSNVTVLGTKTHVASVAAPCDCSNIVPIASIVAAHRGTSNDDASIGLSPTAAVGNNPAQIDLPCGNYYLSQINSSLPLTIAVHGHTALYVDGNVNASAALAFTVDPTATLDLFVAGSINVSGAFSLGSTTAPAHCRAYVSGTGVNLSAGSTFGCNLYAPSASFDTSATGNVFGSLFVSAFNASQSTVVHYDTSILNAGSDCCTTQGCDDQNPCTADSCNADGTCQHSAAANGTACGGSNKCFQSYACQNAVCTGTNPVVCSATDQCHSAGTCDTSTGTCSNPAKADGTACNDGNACTQTDSCQAGSCTGSNPVACATPDQCHAAGSCDPVTGVCSNPAKSDGTACNDGNACTRADTCQTGVCTGANSVVCTALDQCHAAGVCDGATGLCSNPAAPNGTACSDGNACTQSDACLNGVCAGGNAVTCSALDQCHAAGVCDSSTGACSNPAKPNGTACNDGNACTQSDTCQAGACVSGSNVTCAAPDQCHVAGTCDSTTGTCSNPPKSDGTTCSDGNACTSGDACHAGTCTSGSAVNPDDGNPCTVDTCNPGSGPVHQPASAGTTCGSADACHVAPVCDGSGKCQAPAAVSCDDGNPCTDDSCDASTGCRHVNNTASCNDGNACTMGESCSNGACTGGTPLNCDDGNVCTVDTCNPVGACQHAAAPADTVCRAAAGTCDVTEVCGGAMTCPADAKSTAVCRPSAGQCDVAESCNGVGNDCPSDGSRPNGSACDDGDRCTKVDACQGGACVGSSPVACSAIDACHAAGTCDPATGTCSTPVASDGTTCDDGDPCTTGDACHAGVCAGGGGTATDDGNPCTMDACSPTGVTHTPVAAGTSCSDGNPCNGSEVCDSKGRCIGVGAPPIDDANPCTVDACSPTNGVTHVPASAGTSCGAGRVCDGSGSCVATTGCATICAAAVAAACQQTPDQQTCETNLCPGSASANCQPELDDLVQCAGSAPAITCDGEFGFTITGCSTQRLAFAACMLHGTPPPPVTALCQTVADAQCGISGMDCIGLFDKPSVAEQCGDVVTALAACQPSGIECSGALGFTAVGCEDQLDSVRVCDQDGAGALDCRVLCTNVAAANCGLTRDECLSQCSSLGAAGACSDPSAAFLTCAGSQPVTCTPGGAAPFTVAGCEDQFAKALSCATGPCPIFGDSNPCTIDLCDPVLGATHQPATPGSPCGDGKSCTDTGACAPTPGCTTICAAVAASGCVPGQAQTDCEQSPYCPVNGSDSCADVRQALATCAGSAPSVACAGPSLANIPGCERELLAERGCEQFGTAAAQCVDVCIAVAGNGCASDFAAQSACLDACGRGAGQPSCSDQFQAFTNCVAANPSIECPSDPSTPAAFPDCENELSQALACAAGNCVVGEDDGNPCTEDVCNGSDTVHDPVSAGTPCGPGKACDSVGSCVDASPCESICAAAVASGCVPGMAMADCIASTCLASPLCGQALSTLAACAGPTPSIACGGPLGFQVNGCEQQGDILSSCNMGKVDMTPVVKVCAAIGNAHCGMTSDDCLNTLTAYSGCEAALDDLNECAGDNPVATCSGALGSTITGCDAEYLRAALCALGAPSTGCADVCAAVAKDGCGYGISGADCVDVCQQAQSDGSCTSAAAPFLSCASSMGAVECPAVAGCGDAFMAAYGCVAGSCTPTPDDNPCTLDACTPGLGPTHTPTVHLPCAATMTCDPTGACGVERSDPCTAYCEAQVAAGCQSDVSACWAQCPPVKKTCADEFDAVNLCEAKSGVTSCAGWLDVCRDEILTLQQCQSTCAEDDKPCTTVSCTCTSTGCDRTVTNVPINTLCTSDTGGCTGVCDDLGACNAGTASSCAASVCTASGKVNGPASDGTPCTGPNLCVTNQTCSAGTCSGGVLTQIDDGNPCTADSCDSATGVVTHQLLDGQRCSSCGGTGICYAGGCFVTSGPVLDDGNPCTVDACTNNRPTHTPAPVGTSCSDGNDCNGMETCDAFGSCSARSFPLPFGASCSDGNACNGEETCNDAEQCQAGPPPVLDDGNPCTGDTCSVTAGILHVPLPDGTSCSDGNVCNGIETCSNGACTGGAPPDLSDGNACTVDTCDPRAGIQHLPGSSCNDGNPCNGDETCDADGACRAGPMPILSDNNPCTSDSCSPSGGVAHTAVPNGTSCSDGDPCNGAEVCSAGTCTGRPAPTLSDNNPCTIDACDAVHGVTHSPAPAGTSCSDGNNCNGDETCDGTGRCAAGVAPVVSDGNPCTVDACSPSKGVTHTPVADGTFCSDNNVCTGPDRCQGGACAGTSIPIDDHNPCTADTCDRVTGIAHQPLAAGSSCSDHNVCNGAETCDGAGTCQPGTALALADADPCTIDACDPAAGVSHVPAPAGYVCGPSSYCSATGSCDPVIPPDPATVAPAINLTTTLPLVARTSFLYTGDHPVQTGVAPGTIVPRRASLIRGRVLQRSGDPLPGAAVQVRNHPELGGTLSRDDGRYDLVVNGGGRLILDFTKSGYIPAQRPVDAPWNDGVVVDDVVLIPYDTAATVVQLGNTDAIVAAANPVTDDDGTRRATLVFQPGTTAEMQMPDGSLQPLDSITVRATEFTVGPLGPNTMPGELPPTSAYTYAAELSADEAVAAGATTIHFNQPVVLYVDDFLHFPVGTTVPFGSYDRNCGCWKPELNGVIVGVVSITGGLADLDIHGTGTAAAPAELAAIGVTDAERGRIAAMYPVRQRLWRMSTPHFSEVDGNWPLPPLPPPPPPPPPPRVPDNSKQPDPLCESGSIIEVENQVLRENVAIAGTPLKLHYSSERVPGRTDDAIIHVPVSGAAVADATGYSVHITIAGRRFDRDFPAVPNQTYDFLWDRRDAYGRLLQGAQTATVTVDRMYKLPYAVPPSPSRAFALQTLVDLVRLAQVSGYVLEGDLSRATLRNSVTTELLVGGVDAREPEQAAWSFDIHHFYDPASGTLYEGTGAKRGADALGDIVEVVAGRPGPPSSSGLNSGSAKQAVFDAEPIDIAADGALYVSTGNIVYRIDPYKDSIDAFAGGGFGTPPNLGDGGPATQAILQTYSHALAKDGSLFLTQGASNRTFVRRVRPDGIIERVAGSGPYNDLKNWKPCAYQGDDGPALDAEVCNVVAVATAPDCSVYTLENGTTNGSWDGRLRKISPDGYIHTVVKFPGAPPVAHSGLKVAPDGSIYLSRGWAGWPEDCRVERVTPAGTLEVVAGKGCPSGFIDNRPFYGPPQQQTLNAVFELALAKDGTIYASDDERLLEIRPGVNARTLLTSNDANRIVNENGGAAWDQSGAPAVGPDGFLYATNDSSWGKVFRVRPPTPRGVLDAAFVVPSADGSQAYVFDKDGRHTATKHALTGGTLYSFGYDSAGHLTSVTDGNGNVTTITVDTDGHPIQIVAPFGQITSLATDENGYLSRVVDPSGAVTQFSYTADGLMTEMIDAGNGVHSFEWDGGGRLIRDEQPGGGFKTFTQTFDGNTSTIERTTAEGVLASYSSSPDGTGGDVRTNKLDNGLASVMTRNLSTQTFGTRDPDGTQLTTVLGPAPRWGMSAPITQSATASTPGGVVATKTDAQSATVSSTDVASVQMFTDSAANNGLVSTSAFDGAAKASTYTSPEGRSITTRIDGQGRLVELAIPGVAPVDLTYDARGRLAAIVEGSRVTTNSYDASGNLRETTDALNQVQTYDHDALGRVTNHRRADDTVAALAYDAMSNLTTVTPPGRPPHLFTYTLDNRLESYTAPDVGFGPVTTSYVYDLDGHPTAINRPDGSTVHMSYDLSGRMRALVLPGGTATFDYSSSSGNLTTVSGPYGVDLAYDYDGSLLMDTTWSGAISGKVSRTYDNSRRLATEVIDGQAETKIAFTYDKDGLITSVGPSGSAMTLVYDANTPRLLTTKLGSVTDSRTYDQFGQLNTYTAKFGSSVLDDVSYTRDALGRIQKRTETIQGNTRTTEYEYDQVGRLITVTANGAVVRRYGYDDNGNRTRFEDVEHGSTTTGTYDAQDRLLTYGNVSYTYTPSGELQSKTDASKNQTTTYAYNALGTLMHVGLPDGRAIDYVVDGAGRRVGKKINGVLVQGWLYRDGLRPVAELDGSGAVISRFSYTTRPNVPEFVVKHGVTYRIVLDSIGSPRMLVNSATGAVAEEVDRDEFGGVTNDSSSGTVPFGFAGGIYDPDTGLIRFGVRDYDPASGRFMEKDPVGFRGHQYNFYIYAGGDPINRADVFGTYSYTYTWDITSTGIASAAQVMQALQGDPNRFFPFEVREFNGSGQPATIKQGEVLDLYGTLPFHLADPAPVRVTSVSDTCFTFTTLYGHFDPPGSTITFRTLESNGEVFLQQVANAPEAPVWLDLLAPVGTFLNWSFMAMSLSEYFNGNPYTGLSQGSGGP